jgi:hypothetical protein
MRIIPLVSLSALALAGCAASSAEPAAAPVATATPVAAPYAPVIPKGTGIFAEPSTLPFQAPDFSPGSRKAITNRQSSRALRSSWPRLTRSPTIPKRRLLKTPWWRWKTPDRC